MSITDIDVRFMSDHAIPVISLKLTTEDRGPGYWKLNTDLLTDENYQEVIKASFQENVEKYVDIKTRWEMIKMDVRGQSIKFQKRKNKALDNTSDVLMLKEYQLQCEADGSQDTLFNDQDKQLMLIAKDIEEILYKHTKSAKINNQVRWMAGGEKMSKYFFNLERGQYRLPLTRLRIEDKVIDDQTEILEEIRIFYEKLFACTDSEVEDNVLQETDLIKVSEQERLMLDEPLMIQEIEIAIRQMNLQKCPGLDGLPNDFYLTFLTELRQMLHALFLQVIKDESFHATAKEGVISLLEKLGKDQENIRHWRPLSLLCCDRKIFAKIISNRLSLVMDQLIHKDQTGFMKSRYIAQNLMDLNAILAFSESNNLETTVVYIDFCKAYDTISW